MYIVGNMQGTNRSGEGGSGKKIKQPSPSVDKGINVIQQLIHKSYSTV